MYCEFLAPVSWFVSLRDCTSSGVETSRSHKSRDLLDQTIDKSTDSHAEQQSTISLQVVYVCETMCSFVLFRFLLCIPNGSTCMCNV